MSIRAWLGARLSPLYARIRASPLESRLAHGAFWSFLAAVASRVLLLPASILLARILGKEGLGKLGIVQGTVMMYAAFAGIGTGPTATKYIAELRETDPRRASRILTLAGLVSWIVSGVTSAVLFVLSPSMAQTLKAPELTAPLRIATVLLFFTAINASQAGALAGLEAFKSLAKITAVTGLLTFPLTVIGALTGGVRGALWGYAAAAVMTWVAYHLALRIEARRFGITLSLRGCTQESAVFWKFSIPALLAGLATAPATWFASAVLFRQPGGVAETAVLRVAEQWRAFILFFPGMFTSVLLPMLANLHGIRDRAAYVKTLKLGLLVTATTSGGMAILLGLSSGLVMRAYGPSFADGAPTLVLMALSGVASSCASVASVAITSSGKMWLGVGLNTAWGIVYAGTTYLLVRWGARGAALAHLISYVFHLLTIAVVARWMILAQTSVGADGDAVAEPIVAPSPSAPPPSA